MTLKDDLDRIQEEIDFLNLDYEPLKNKLRLNKQEAILKKELGTKLFALNIRAIGILNRMDKEKRKMS